MADFYSFFINSNQALNETKAYEYLVKDKLDRTQDKPQAQAKEIDWYSMEDFLGANSFIPGMFYTFNYSGKIEMSAGKNTFIDKVPLCLCIGTNLTSVLGFNFNLILNDVRARILDELYNIDKDFFENELPYKLKKRQPAVSQAIGSMFLNKDQRNKFISYIAFKYKIPESSFAYRRYDKQFVSNAKLIDYYLWKWIPFLNFQNSIRGMNLREVQLENILKQ